MNDNFPTFKRWGNGIRGIYARGYAVRLLSWCVVLLSVIFLFSVDSKLRWYGLSGAEHILWQFILPVTAGVFLLTLVACGKSCIRAIISVVCSGAGAPENDIRLAYHAVRTAQNIALALGSLATLAGVIWLYLRIEDFSGVIVRLVLVAAGVLSGVLISEFVLGPIALFIKRGREIEEPVMAWRWRGLMAALMSLFVISTIWNFFTVAFRHDIGPFAPSYAEDGNYIHCYFVNAAKLRHEGKRASLVYGTDSRRDIESHRVVDGNKLVLIYRGYHNIPLVWDDQWSEKLTIEFDDFHGDGVYELSSDKIRAYYSAISLHWGRGHTNSASSKEIKGTIVISDAVKHGEPRATYRIFRAKLDLKVPSPDAPLGMYSARPSAYPIKLGKKSEPMTFIGLHVAHISNDAWLNGGAIEPAFMVP